MPSTKSMFFLLTIYIYFSQKDLRKKSGLRGRRAKRQVVTRLFQDKNSGRRVDFVDMSNFRQEKHKKSCRIVNKTGYFVVVMSTQKKIVMTQQNNKLINNGDYNDD